MASWQGNQTTYDDAWQLWHEVEQTYGCTLECTVWPPRLLGNNQPYPPMVAVKATVKGAEPGRTIGRNCPIGGARGARTMPAALVRALTELAAALEERQQTRAQQAAF